MALIINIKTPKGCANCPLKRYWEANPWTYGYKCIVTDKNVDKESNAGIFHEDCPIIGEIPNEHGRLVDADKLLDGHPKEANWDYMVLECIIRNAPTVVEGTGERT